jgi:DHA3 family macrolide efflux protein-like MFS transporter
MSDKLFNRNYLLLFQGQMVSHIGTAMSMAAMLFWLKNAAESALLVSLLGVAAIVPGMLLNPFGGVLADNVSRKKIIVTGDVLVGLANLGFGCIMFFELASTSTIILLAFFVTIFGGSVGAFFGPAAAALLPDMVAKDKLHAASGALDGATQASKLIGNILGGVLFRVLGAPLTIILDGITYILSGISESFIKVKETAKPKREQSAKVGHVFRRIREDLAGGVSYVRGNRGLIMLMVCSIIAEMPFAPLVIVLPFFVENTLGVTSDWYGFIVAALFVGVILGNVASGIVKLRDEHRKHGVWLSIVGAGGGLMLLSIATQPVFALAYIALAGIFLGYLGVMIKVGIQLNTPSEFKGRVFGLLNSITSVIILVNVVVSGILIDRMGQDMSRFFLFGGLIVALFSLLVIFSRSLKQAFGEKVGEEQSDTAAEPLVNEA